MRQHFKRIFSITTANRLLDTPVAREVLRDSDRNRLFSGDGATAGGLIITDDIKFLTAIPATNLEHGDIIYVDTTGGAFQITLPAGAPDGDWVRFVDIGDNCTAANVTVNADTTIEGDPSPFLLNWDGARGWFIKRGGVWIVDRERITTHADTVANWFALAIGAVGTAIRVRADGQAFENYTPVSEIPATDGRYLLDITGGTPTWSAYIKPSYTETFTASTGGAILETTHGLGTGKKGAIFYEGDSQFFPTVSCTDGGDLTWSATVAKTGTVVIFR